MTLLETATPGTVVVSRSYSGRVFLRDLPEFQIFDAIINLITVLMVNTFVWFKVTMKRLFHDEAMFCNVSICLSKWMMRHKNIAISSGLTREATAPFMTIAALSGRTRSVSFAAWGRKSFEVTFLGDSEFANRSRKAATTFAESGWNLVRTWDESAVVTFNVRTAIMDCTSATTFTRRHGLVSATSPVYSRGW